MKISVKEGGFYFSLWLPLRMVTSNTVWKFVCNGCDKHVFTKQQRKEIYKLLKNYVKTNGHFVFLNVNSTDGTKVKITV